MCFSLFNLDNAITNALRTVKSPYTVFIIISDFINTKKESIDKLKLMSARFETIAVMVRDRMDEELPDSGYQLAVQDPYSGRQLLLDPHIAGERYKKNVIKRKNVVRTLMEDSGIDLVELVTDKGFVGPVSGFLKGRAKGARI